MLEVEICVDVPDLDEGLRFYGEAFGFAPVLQPYPGVAVIAADGVKITLLQKREGSSPSPGATDVRRYQRHWTPVHVDFHVDDFRAALDRAVAAGAVQEQVFDHPDHGSAAFCSDPFGNGFCILHRKPK